jgi:hypothetical protein
VLGSLQVALNIDAVRASAVVNAVVHRAKHASAPSRWRVALLVVFAGMIVSPLSWVPPAPKTLDELHRTAKTVAPHIDSTL